MLRPILSCLALFLFCAVAVPPQAQAQAQANSLTHDVNTWLRLRQDKNPADFATYARFLNTRSNWPESGKIRLHAERALLKNADRATILQWFDTHKPVTDDAALRYVIALADNNRTTEASGYLKEKWRQGSFNNDQQDKIREYFWKWLTEDDHRKRADNLIWQSKLDRADRSISYIQSAAIRQAGQARIALQRGNSKALAMMHALPETARSDNGVIFDLVRYYRQKNQDDKAAEILARRRKAIDSYNAQWWRERNLLARRAFERKNFQRAYDLAATHGHTGGLELAEAEWFAGWIALTRLKKPDTAYKHFDHMYRNVKAPISVSRAAYWAGIAAGQKGDKEQSLTWYRLAAKHMNTFYGQMAAYALGQPRDYFADFFKRDQAVPDNIDPRLRSDMIGAARLLNSMKKQAERDMFLRAALQDARSKKIVHLMIPVAREFKHHGIALAAAKSAYDNDILISDALFPRTNVPHNPKTDKALTLSIIRQESMFDSLATSTANARGLMQILPTTASHVAKRQNIPHKNAEQLYQPHHNMILGQAYLGGLLERYDGFVPLAAAGYNAGPGNVTKWLDEMGDPRKDPYTWVDWVERIPFYETRNYVQRVWENYMAYKYLLNMK